jgi:hypothetical protein
VRYDLAVVTEGLSRLLQGRNGARDVPPVNRCSRPQNALPDHHLDFIGSSHSALHEVNDVACCHGRERERCTRQTNRKPVPNACDGLSLNQELRLAHGVEAN